MKYIIRSSLCFLYLCSCTHSSKQSTRRERKTPRDRNAIAARIDSTKKKNKEDSIKDAKGWEHYQQSFVLANYIVKDAPTSDVEKLDSDAAVFIYPDSEQVEEMKKEDGEENFYIGADDAQYYQGTSIGICDSLKIKVFVPEKRYVQFVSKVKTFYFDTRAKASTGWMAILFRTDSLPRIVSTVDLATDTALADYFKRK